MPEIEHSVKISDDLTMLGLGTFEAPYGCEQYQSLPLLVEHVAKRVDIQEKLLEGEHIFFVWNGVQVGVRNYSKRGGRSRSLLPTIDVFFVPNDDYTLEKGFVSLVQNSHIIDKAVTIRDIFVEAFFG